MQPDPDLPRVAGVADRGPHRERQVRRRRGRGRPDVPGSPAAAMYASPMVLIFSTPSAAQAASKAENSALSEDTSSPTSSRAEISVNPTKSLKTTATSSYRSAISRSPLPSRSTIVSRQDVEQERARAGLLGLQLATDPVEEPQVGVADRPRHPRAVSRVARPAGVSLAISFSSASGVRSPGTPDPSLMCRAGGSRTSR